MRRFIVRTITGHIDPQALVSGLWAGPQWGRLLMYSILFHACVAMSFILVRSFHLTFRTPIREIAYNVDLVEMSRPSSRGNATSSRAEQKEESKAKVKPEAKPKEQVKPAPKPEPKPLKKVLEKKPVPVQDKKVEVPKAVQSSVAKQQTPQVKSSPDVVEVKKEEEPSTREAAQPDSEPAQTAKAIPSESAATAGSTIDLDTESITPELKWYIEIIRRKVWQNWIEPVHALTPGTHARVVIRFEIGRDGKFTNEPMVFEPSNNLALDQSGYHAVLRSVPFPPLPESYSGSSLGVRFGFEYGEGV